MPLFKSLRSKSSLKSSSASILSENDKPSDFGPRSPSNATFTSKKGADFNSVGRNGNKNNYASGLPSSPSAASVRTNQSNAVQAQQPNLMEVVTPSESFSSMPKPSELFAGKGVQWETVKLAGPGSSPAVQERNTQNNTEDLQAFLKQRRQWKPTFVTEETTPRSTAPTDLNKLSFTSPETTLNSRGLMSFEDLDKSHQRKQQLLSDHPLGDNLWESPETSKAGAAKAGVNESTAKTAPARPTELAQKRTSSFKLGRKNTNPPVASAPVAPSRTSSTQQVVNSTKTTIASTAATNEASSNPAVPPYPTDYAVQQKQDAGLAKSVAPDKNGSADLPPPITSTPASEGHSNVVSQPATTAQNSEHLKATDGPANETSNVRQSIDTAGGFATPEGTSRPVSSHDLATGVNSNISNGDAQGLSAQVDHPETVVEEPTTPTVAKISTVRADLDTTPMKQTSTADAAGAAADAAAAAPTSNA